MNSLLLVAYIAVCLLTIVVVFLQHGKGSQMGAAFSPQTSKDLFGSSGPKDFFYVMTKWLIFFFFSLALLMTILDTRAQTRLQEQSSSWTPASELLREEN